MLIHLTKVTKISKANTESYKGYLKGEETVQSVIKSRLIFQETFVLLTERKPVSSFALTFNIKKSFIQLNLFSP